MSDRPQRGLLPFLCVGHSIDHMFMLLYPTVVLALEVEMGRSYGELLSLSIGGFIMFGLGAPLAGWLSDRWSASGAMTTFFVGIGLACIATGFATGPVGLFVGLTLIGLFASIYHPVGIALIVQTAGNRRGRYLGINGVFGSAGMGMAALVAGALMELISWRAAFILPGAVSVVIGIWFAIVFRGGIRKAPVAADAGRPAGGMREFVRIMIVIGVITVLSGMVFQALTIGLPKFLDHRVDFLQGGGLGIGMATTIIMLLGGAAQLGGGLLADRMPLRQAYFLVYGMMVPVMAVATVAAGAPLMLVMVMAIAITVGIQPVADSLFARFIPPKWLSTAFGFRFALSLTVSA
ncbi:MAG: MFS transporter, partial [Alphaproteobacteria bacterium]